MILPERALKGNGDKGVKEFLSTLESATSRLDIRECYVWQLRVGREAASYSFAYHVSCKVKYFGKVANV